MPRMRPFGTFLLVGSLLAAGLAVVPAATAATGPSTASPTVTLRLVAHNPTKSGGNATVEVFATSVRGLAGWELNASVATRGATLAGADSTSAHTSSAGFLDSSISERESSAVLAAYSPKGHTLSGNVKLGTLYVDDVKAASVTVAIGAVRLVGADGRSIAGRFTGLSVNLSSAQLQRGKVVHSVTAPAAPYALPATASAAVKRSANPDLPQLWQTVRLAGQPCTTSTRALDRNGDGCLDIGDLVLNGEASRAASPDVQLPSGAKAATRPTTFAKAQATPAVASKAATAAVTPAAVGTTFVVNTVTDEWDQSVGNGICKTASGVCSLRAAIQEADAAPGVNTIAFNIPGAGVHTIQLTKVLPGVNDASGGTLIDGYTQPGSSPNTDPVVDNAKLMIEIRGNGATGDGTTTGFDALPITSAYNEVRGLAMYNSRRELWVHGSSATHNIFVGNFIGTDSTGTFVTPAIQLDAFGMHIEQDAGYALIGTSDTSQNPTPADRNVISGNGRQGVGLWHNNTDFAVIVNNIVGLSPDGTRGLPNRKHGLDLNFGVSNTQIGGLRPGERNVVSDNDDDGIEVSHTTLTTQNDIIGNYIGTDVTGNAAFAWTQNKNTGVFIEDASHANVVEQNVIVNNAHGGVVTTTNGTNGITAANVIKNNRIGVGINGAALPNGLFGVDLDGSGNTVGPGNLIQNNNGPGVEVTQTDSINNKITQNTIADNTGLSIDLSPVGSSNPNNPVPHTGANNGQNFPDNLTYEFGTITGSSCAGCTVEIFTTGTATGSGPARGYQGSVTADPSGNFSYPNSLPIGTAVSMYAIAPNGDTSEMSPNVSIVRLDIAPTIKLGPDVSVAEGSALALNATVIDPDDTNDVVTWDLNGDGTLETTGNPVTFDASALDGPLTRTVTAKVTDSAGKSATATMVVTVTNVAPTGTLSATSPIAEGGTSLVTFSNVTDPSGADTSAGLHYAFACDGSSLAGATYAGSSAAPSTTCPMPDGPATPTVNGAVIDKDGGLTQYSASVTVTNVAPTAKFTGLPSSPDEGKLITLTDASTDPSPSDTTVGLSPTWTVTTGGATVATGSGATFGYTPPDDGTYTVQLSVTDKDGATNSTSSTFHVFNLPPSATFGVSSTTSGAATTSTLSLNAPTDGPADTTAGFRYAFACPNTTISVTTYAQASTSNTATCVYSSASDNTLRGRVFDKDSGYTDYITVPGSGQAPTISAPASVKVGEGGTVTLTATATSATNSPVTYAWDLDGNGTFETPGQTVNFNASGRDGPGVAVAAVQATDANGTAGTSTQITIINVAPTASFAALAAPEGTATTFSLQNVSDPSTADQASLHAAFDCNGGSLSAATYANSSATLSVACSYADGPGTATVHAILFDKDGGATDITAPVTITNVAPSVAVQVTTPSPHSGSTVNATLNVTDPGSVDTSAGFGVSWTVTFGGSTVASGSGTAVSFPANSNGTYTISGTALDKDGASGTGSLDVVVTGLPPSATFVAPATGNEGQPFTLALTNATDPSPANLAAGLHFAFSCTGADLSTTSYSAAGTSGTITCTPPDNNAALAVTGAVIDKDGLLTQYSAHVNVANLAPIARVVDPDEVVAGTPLLIAVDQAYDSPADLAAGLTYSFDCTGTGSGYSAPSATSTATCPSGNGPTATVLVRVADNSGASTTYTAVVLVHSNLLANGNLEAGTTSPSNWTWGTQKQWVTSPVLSGTHAVASVATGTATNASISQTYSGLETYSHYLVDAQFNVPAAGSGSAQLLARWLDSTGKIIATVTVGTVSNPTNGWVHLTTSFPDRMTASALRIDVVWNTTNRAIAVDDIVLRRDNAVLDGELDQDTNGDGKPDSWPPQSRFTRDSSLYRASGFSGKAAGDGGAFTVAQRVAVGAGNPYLISGWINAPQTSAVYLIIVQVRWQDDAQNTLRLDKVKVYGDNKTPFGTPGWQQFAGQLTAPPGATQANLEIFFSTGFTGTDHIDSVVIGKQ